MTTTPGPDGGPRSVWTVVPFPLRAAAAWAAVMGVIAGGVVGLVLVLAEVGVVVWAMVGALLLSALLGPAVRALRAAGVPRMLSAVVVFVGFLAVLAVAIWLIGREVAGQFDDLGDQVDAGIQQVRDWITDTFPVSDADLDRVGDQAGTWLSDSAGGGLVGQVASAAGTAVSVVSGTVLALFVTFFVLSDGRRMWGWVVSTFPRGAREAVDAAGGRAWGALEGYMRGIVIVGLLDATLIGIALAVLGVPLALPLAVLTFLGAFIPLVGATLAGAAATLVALADEGLGTALVLLVIVVVVQQLDSDLLQPLIISRAVHLHPVAVALAVTAGGLLAGLGGVVAATPLLAAVYAMVRPYRAEAAGVGGADEAGEDRPGRIRRPGIRRRRGRS